jgi:hypothetical protein
MYPEAPLKKSITRYEINSVDSVIRKISRENFNDKGWKTEYIEYSYFDTEELKEIYEYSDAGKIVRISSGDLSSNLSYNENGLLKMMDSEQMDIEFNYNEKRLLSEMKYIRDGQSVGYQRFEYKYDDKDSVKELKKYDKFIDEPSETLQMHRSMKYDNAGNVTEEISYIKDIPGSVDSNWYNEYGKCIYKLEYDYPDRLKSKSKFEYDQYGNLIRKFTEKYDGEILGEKYVYEYSE